MSNYRFNIESVTTLRLSGKDTLDFLHRISTANVKQLAPNQTLPCAFLNAKGQIICLSYLSRFSEHYELISFDAPKDSFFQHLEKYHFSEELQIEDLSDSFDYYFTPKPPPELFSFREDAFEQGYYMRAPSHTPIKDSVPMPPEQYEFLRVQAGIPIQGKDFTAQEILLEIGRDIAVARNKGCYPGQEVIERIFTYGSVNKRLCRLDITGTTPIPTLPYEFRVDEKICLLTSATFNPSSPEKGAALAYLPKSLWSYPNSFEIIPGFHGKLRPE